MENRSDSVSWLDKDIKRFKDTGTFIPKSQWKIYASIRDHWVHGRTVVDVGCSAGFGSNVLSHAARHVWGIDVNQEAVRFADVMFKRPNLSFDVFDIEHPMERPVSQFETVTMIEVIEHLPDFERGLDTIKRFFSDKLNTVGFITVPNINNERIRAADAANDLHVNHWTPGEFYELMIRHFKHVTMFSGDILKTWGQEETIDGSNDTCSIVIVKVEGKL